MLFVGRHVSKLSGYAPALPTPFDQNGAVDRAALERLCELQIREGATALVVCRRMYLALKRGQVREAQRLAAAVMKLTGALFSETNPAPVKYALSLLNLMSPRVRLPLSELSDRSKCELAAVWMMCGKGFWQLLVTPGAGEGNRTLVCSLGS
jgi:dihydrodipicolinate synthase/N-acetylneuraminate lyase